MTKESRISALQDLIVSLNDPILESLLHSPDFNEFLLTQGPGLSALIRQSILDLFRVHSHENGGNGSSSQQPAGPCSWQEAKTIQSRQCAGPTHTYPRADSFPTAPTLLYNVVTTPEKAVQLSGSTNSDLLRNCQPGPEPAHSTALTQQSPESIRNAIVDLIEETTGYPRDMIGLDKSLERDLRIDSIKRNEMLLVLQKELSIPPVSDDSFWQDESVNSLTQKLLILMNR